MFRRLLRSVTAVFTRDEADEEPEDHTDENEFVPSEMDRSVRVAHGGADDEIERAFEDIEQQARELEDLDR